MTSLSIVDSARNVHIVSHKRNMLKKVHQKFQDLINHVGGLSQHAHAAAEVQLFEAGHRQRSLQATL